LISLIGALVLSYSKTLGYSILLLFLTAFFPPPLSVLHAQTHTYQFSLNRLKTHAYIEAGVQALVGQERIQGFLAYHRNLLTYLRRPVTHRSLRVPAISFCFEAHIAWGDIAREIKFGVYFWVLLILCSAAATAPLAGVAIWPFWNCLQEMKRFCYLAIFKS